LDTAISARIEEKTQPAISLSGGRDSNTIASIVVDSLDIAPTTYSHVSTNDFGNERIRTEMENIDHMQEVFDLDSTRIGIDNYEFKYDVCSSDYSFGLPVLDPYLHMQVQLYQEVSQRGEILLDGFGGNCFDGAGLHYYDLLTTGKIYQLIRRAYRDGGSMAANLISSILPLLTTLPLMNSTKQEPAWLTVEPASFDIDMSVTSLEQRFMLRFLLKHTKSVMRFQARQAALKHGVDLRFPLMDERLHREVLKMPPGSLRAGGRLKGLFLDAVNNVLPPKIERFDVGMPFDPFLKQGLANYGAENIELTLQTLHTSDLSIVDEEIVRPAISNYTNGAETEGIKPIHLWKLLTIEKWLQDHNRRTNLSIT
jgi:asparagine synthetase B (glutamine-hydrolysing)